jgi:hypothetical protein
MTSGTGLSGGGFRVAVRNEERKMTDLYRHFDNEGKLLYVGISKSALVRLGQHEEHAHWFDRIAQVTIEKHPSRAVALEAERTAIIREKPLCNIMGRELPTGKAPTEDDWSTLAGKSATALTSSLVYFNTTYRAEDIAKHLWISVVAAKRLIESSEIGSVEFEDRGRPVRRVTGWQLIEYIESCERKATKKKGKDNE